jgi:hypothetical protein
LFPHVSDTVPVPVYRYPRFLCSGTGTVHCGLRNTKVLVPPGKNLACSLICIPVSSFLIANAKFLFSLGQCCGSGMFYPGSRIRIRPLLHPGSGSRIRGVKKHRIPDPGSDLFFYKFCLLIPDPGSGSDHCSIPNPDPGSGG